MIQEILIRKQTPKEGMWLTQFDANSNTYTDSKQVYLGKGAEEWVECTEDEHQEHVAHNERVREEQEKAMEAEQ
jgi:hypothetical protein